MRPAHSRRSSLTKRVTGSKSGWTSASLLPSGEFTSTTVTCLRPQLADAVQGSLAPTDFFKTIKGVVSSSASSARKMPQKERQRVKLIRPRFTEFHDIFVPQAELDFAIPFLGEDIPLYVDPFLLWRSPSSQDKGLHQMMLGAFNNLGDLVKSGEEGKAIQQLIAASECDEVGLGTSATKKGRGLVAPKQRRY